MKTRGVYIGAKSAIPALIDELAGHGLAVMLISSELPEVINLSTRILVMREGEIVGQLSRGTGFAGCSLAFDGRRGLESGLSPSRKSRGVVPRRIRL